MATLADLAPLQSSVKIRGMEIDVFPLRLSDVALLISKHKSLISVFDSGDVAEAIQGAGPEAVSDAIAAATRQTLKDVKSAGLSAAEEGLIVFETVDLTLPDEQEEMDAFMKALLKLIERVSAAKQPGSN